MSEHANRTDKPPAENRFALLWQRVKEHRIAQWTVGYVALAYAIQHAVILTSESFEWPNLIARITMLLLVLGLPLAMTLAWYHSDGSNRRVSGPELTIISLLLVGISFLFYVFARPSENVATGPKPATQQASVAPAAVRGALSIAVLPFANLSGDASQEFFSDGMTEEITSALAKVQSVRMVGRSSAFQFKGQNRDLRAIGQALGANYLIDGSVRKAGVQVRITAQLIQADNGVSVWTDTYDRELKNIFATQSDIATAIAGALRVPLGLKQGETLVASRTGNEAVYEDYLRAKALVRSRGTEGLKALTDAAALLEQVVARDPNFAPAWALLAQAYALTTAGAFNAADAFNNNVDERRRIDDASLPRAEAAAQRAIQLGPNQADGYASLGNVQHSRGKLALAEESYSKALALDSNNPDALNQYSLFLSSIGRPKEALAMRQKLYALEPFVPRFNQLFADALWLNGQSDAAIAMLKDSAGARPQLLARIHAAAGRFGEAADALSTIPPETYPPGVVESAVRLMRTAPAPAASPQSLPALGPLGFVYLYVGAPDRSLEYDETIVKSGRALSIYYLQHPSYASVRKTERFKRLVRAGGLVDYWKARGWPDLCHPVVADDFACD